MKTAQLVDLKAIEKLPGFILNYLLCGPFNQDLALSSCKALGKNYLVSSGTEGRAQPKSGDREGVNGPCWQQHAIRFGYAVDLRQHYPKEGIVSYAVAYLHSPRNEKVCFLLGSDKGIKVYVNGKQAWFNHVHRGLGIDNDRFEADLKKGVNTILLKIEYHSGGYEFCLRITGLDGKRFDGVKAYVDHPSVTNAVDPATQRSVQTADYLAYQFSKCTPRLEFSCNSPDEFRDWRRAVLSQLRALLGRLPKKCPLNPSVTEICEGEHFVRKRILLDFEPGYSFPCYVTFPTRSLSRRRTPAILCLHGHGNGKSDMVGYDLNTPREQPWSRQYAHAIHAAEEGIIGISPDLLSWGERAPQGKFYGCLDACAGDFAWALSVGIVTTALNIHVAMRCLDYLSTLSTVDPRRLVAMGHSHGAYITLMTMALEPRIRASVLSGFICTNSAFYGKPWYCGSQVVPGLFRHVDLSDIGCTLAPRPILLMNGLYDTCASAPFAEAAFRKIRKAYSLFGKTQNVTHYTFKGGHECQNDIAFAWLRKIFATC